MLPSPCEFWATSAAISTVTAPCAAGVRLNVYNESLPEKSLAAPLAKVRSLAAKPVTARENIAFIGIGDVLVGEDSVDVIVTEGLSDRSNSPVPSIFFTMTGKSLVISLLFPNWPSLFSPHL